MTPEDIEKLVKEEIEKEKLKGSSLDEAKFLWSEYQYRHEHCWNTLFKLTAAISLLSTVPYIKDSVVKVLGDLMLAGPILAVILLAFSSYRLRRELVILDKIKTKYRTLQKKAFCIEHDPAVVKFAHSVYLYLAALATLALGNSFVVFYCWIPKLTDEYARCIIDTPS